MLKRVIYSLLFLFHCVAGSAQLGGSRIYQFLNLPQSAQVASLGGITASYRGENPGLAVYNPAALNRQMFHRIQVNESFYAPGIKYSSVNYATQGKKGKMYALGVQNLSFEKMDQRDESGQKTGSFFANETVLYFSKGHTIGNYTIGLNAKYAQSFIQRYMSSALLGDLGIMFHHPEKDFNFGLVIRNVGVQLKSYSGVREPLPLQINAGVTFKPEHMPLKMSITTHDLQRFNIVYLDPAPVCQDFSCEELISPKAGLGDKILRHFNFSGDLSLSKNVNFRIGYSFQRRKELKLSTSGGAGFSLGFLMRIKNFDVEYGKIYYQYAGRPAYISITTNTDRFFKKKNNDTYNEPTNPI